MASAFMRASLFARPYSFSDVSDEVWHELSGVLDGYAEQGVDPKTGEPIMVLPMQDYDPKGHAIPKLDDGPEPASWYMWVAAKLGLILRNDWEQLDHDVRAIAALWGEEDNDHALAHRLYNITDTVRWGIGPWSGTEVRSDGSYHPPSQGPHRDDRVWGESI